MSKGLDRILFVQIFFICMTPSCILSAQVLTLDSIRNIIERDQPGLKHYDFRILAYDTYAGGARALDPPRAGGGFFMTPYNPGMWGSDAASGSQGMGSFMITAEQMFLNPKKRSANLDYMGSMSGPDKEMKKAMRNELFSMAGMGYYEWIVMKKKLVVLEQSESLLNYLVSNAESRYTYSMDKLNGYYKAKAMLGDIRSMKSMTAAEITVQRKALNTLMNRPADLVFDIDTLFLIRNYETEPVDSSRIKGARSDYRAMDRHIFMLENKRKYELSKSLPDFGIKYDHMFAFGKQPWQYSLMFMVSIPIVPWSSKMYRSAASGLLAEIDAVRYEQKELVLRVSGETSALREKIRLKKEQMSLYETMILPSMDRNYKAALLAYEQNTEELFMVLDALQNLKISRLAYYDLLRELLLLQVEYEKQLEMK